MIKIKNHIYNENEIISIHESTENDSISIKFKADSYFILENATFEDIEWNYENNNEYCNVFYEDRIKELEKENKTLKELNVCVGCDNNPDYKTRIKELEEENKRLELENEKHKSWVNSLNKDNHKFRDRINKAIEQLKTANVDIDSVRLCEVIQYAEFILKGEEK